MNDTAEPTIGPSSSELIFAGEAPAATLSARVRRGELRRLARGIYTTNLSDPPEEVVRRNRWAITSTLFPGAVISDRSALPGAQVPTTIFLAHPGPPATSLCRASSSVPAPVPGRSRAAGPSGSTPSILFVAGSVAYQRLAVEPGRPDE